MSAAITPISSAPSFCQSDLGRVEVPCLDAEAAERLALSLCASGTQARSVGAAVTVFVDVSRRPIEQWNLLVVSAAVLMGCASADDCASLLV